MANSTKQPPKRGKIKQMPRQNGNVAIEDPPEVPEQPPITQTPFDEPQKAAEPVPDLGLKPPPQKSEGRARSKGDFFDTVRRIPKEDWGTRVFLYLYCWEPICDEKLSGEKRYLNRYSQPVLDEHAIMVDYGSGKYRLTLTNRKPATNENGAPIETYDFEIYNPKYPPKIPRKVWKNDPRNARWEALLPPETLAPPPPIDPLAAFDTYMNIQDRIEERIKPAATPPAAPAPAPAPDPFDTATKFMGLQLQMRSADPMVAALLSRLEAADKAAEASRQREFELMREMRQQPAAAPQKGIVDQLVELIPMLDKLKPLKEFLGLNGATEPPRHVRMGAYEMVRDLAQTDFGRNLGQGLGVLLSNLASKPAANGQQQPIPPVMSGASPNGTAAPSETDEQRIQRIGQQITQPMLYEFFLKDLSGEEFAERMFDLWPEDYTFIRKLGWQNLVDRYRRFTPAWAVIAPKEPAFVEFIQEFCAWQEPATEAEAAEDDAAVTDLDEQVQGAGA
jgi:hypothetical protein